MDRGQGGGEACQWIDGELWGWWGFGWFVGYDLGLRVVASDLFNFVWIQKHFAYLEGGLRPSKGAKDRLRDTSSDVEIMNMNRMLFRIAG